MIFWSAIFALAGLSWRLGGSLWWVGPLCSLSLPLILPRFSGTRLASILAGGQYRFACAFSYFATGSFGIIPGSGVFFGHGTSSYALGVALWFVSSIFLAAPWIFAKSGIGALVAMLIDALPPLGLFGWLSPFAAAGVLYPSCGILGFAGLAALIVAANPGFNLIDAKDSRPGRVLKPLLPIIIGINLINANYNWHDNPAAPPIFTGINTHLGLMPRSPMAIIRRNQTLIAAGLRSNNQAPIKVFPETVATWLPGTANQIRTFVPPGQAWLIGETVGNENGTFSDAVVEVRPGLPDREVFSSALPVPVSMWHPWKSDGEYAAAWWEPVQVIGGKKVWVSICYDQLLFWPWLNAIELRPDTILAISNEWWAKGTGIPVIQQDTTRAYARLIGAQIIWAENR